MSSRRCEGEIRAAARLSAEIVLSIATELESRAEAAPLRGELARVVRQLEDHLELLP